MMLKKKRLDDKKRMGSRWIAWMLSLMMLLCMWSPLSVKADEVVKGSIQFVAEVSAVPFRLYKIGNVDETGKVTLLDEYKNLQINWDADQRQVAATLDAYIRSEKYTPDQEVRTDAEGIATFADLERAAYLLSGDVFETEEGMICTPAPVLVYMPERIEIGKDNFMDNWDIVIKDKIEIRYPKDKIDIEVKKIWADKESSDRPESIVVQLMKGEDVYQEVTLNKENNWSYKWTELEDKVLWSVVEKEVPKGYKVSIEKEHDTIVITNTNNPPNTPPGNPPGSPPGSRLPQTGQLWWPVFYLLAGGLFFMAIGMLMKRKAD